MLYATDMNKRDSRTYVSCGCLSDVSYYEFENGNLPVIELRRRVLGVCARASRQELHPANVY